MKKLTCIVVLMVCAMVWAYSVQAQVRVITDPKEALVETASSDGKGLADWCYNAHDTPRSPEIVGMLKDTAIFMGYTKSDDILAFIRIAQAAMEGATESHIASRY
jgi:hypothetical protein